MPTPPSTTPPSATRTAATPSTAPDRVVRRRDGIALAATGAIPDRVRAQILAEHRTHLTGCARAGVRARLDAGLLPLPIPYGYRRMNTLRAPGHLDTRHPLTTGSGPTVMSTTRNCRCGHAPAQHWLTDPDSAATVRYMAGCIRFGMTPAQLATHLNNNPDLPPLLTLSGRPRPWTGRTVATLLTDPVLTGHSVWGRTHHGRPRPRHEWMVSTAPTHPPILGPAGVSVLTETLAGEPTTKPTIKPRAGRLAQACPARSRWRR